MKWRAISIVTMLIMSALFIGAGNALAVPYSGTIELSDGSNVQDYFEPSDGIYFDVTVLDDGAPLQSQSVDVVIYGLAGIGEVFNYSYYTDSYGEFSGDYWDDSWMSRSIGDYIMYVNYTGQEVINKTFKIYNPVAWSADCWTTYDSETVDEFTEGQWVTYNVIVYDQFGNPFDGYIWDGVEISKDGWVASSPNLDTNADGEDDGTYYPSGSTQFGTYMITIYNDIYDPIGFHNFTVVLPSRAVIWPQYYGDNRTVFTEGENVGYELQLFHQTTIPYDSDGQAARILLFHEDDMINPLRNNSLTTDTDGVDSTWNFYNIGYGDEYKGVYYIRVYNLTWNIIGTGVFMVIDLDIQLLPDKSVYSQGDYVQLSVKTSLKEAYTVKITDSSHTGLSGASWNVPAGTYEWLKDFTFPEIDDGEYNIDAYMDGLLLGSFTFQLKKFSVELRLSQDSFLPGQSGTLFWRAVNNHDGGPITISADTDMNYLDEDWDWNTDALDDLAGSAGSFGFTVPKDAMVGNSGSIDVDAEDTHDHTDYASAGFNVGSLTVTVEKDRTSYRPGDSVYLTFMSKVSGSDSIVPNVEIRARAQNDGTTIGDSWTITTDGSGRATFVYSIPAGAEDGLYIIVMNTTFDSNRNIRYNGTSEFMVSSEPVVSIVLYQGVSFFAPGDTVSVPYRVMNDGVEIGDARVSYEARLGGWSWNSADTIALGFGSNGVISFKLPADKIGRLYVQASAITDDGTAFDQLDSMQVSNAQLTLFATKSIYLPGENVTWSYVLVGDTVSSVTYRITDPDGVLLAEGVPTNGSFTFRLPDNYARNPTATIYVTGADDTYITASTAAVYEGYLLEFWTLQNSYSPGDVMEINYTIIKVGHGPEVIGGFQVQINFWGEFTDTVWVNEDTGIISYELSEDLTDGKHLVQVTLVGAPNTFDDIQTIIIDSDAGELAHGTTLGLNTGAFIALLIGLIGLIIAIVGVKMAKSKGKAAPAEPAPAAAPPAPPEPVVEEPVPVESYPPPPETVEEQTVEPETQPGDYPPPPTDY